MRGIKGMIWEPSLLDADEVGAWSNNRRVSRDDMHDVLLRADDAYCAMTRIMR